jgi:hypothetical protein
MQELVAPKALRFYDTKWSYFGDKRTLAYALVEITGIPRPFLLGLTSLHEASVAQRMSWAVHRVTKRKEDLAYCLLGMFDINMPMIYGEGDRAFRRLQEEIIRRIPDDSLFAWGFNSTPRRIDAAAEVTQGVLASSPADFATCGDIVASQQSNNS